MDNRTHAHAQVGYAPPPGDPAVAGRVEARPPDGWTAPSFSYRGCMATFNLHARQHLHLVWHNGVVLDDPAG